MGLFRGAGASAANGAEQLVCITSSTPPNRMVVLAPSSSESGSESIVRDCHEIISSIEQRNAG